MKESSAETRGQKNATNLWTEEVHVSRSCCMRWKNKSNSEKWYFISIIFLLIIIALMANIFIFLTIGGELHFGKHHKREVCVTSECVQVAATILHRMDTSVDPCKDFYNYSCGNFIRNNPVPDDHYIKNLLQEIQDKVYFEMKIYLEAVWRESEGKAIKEIKFLYNSCMNETNSNDEKKAMTALLNIFDEIGGQWPLISSGDDLKIDLEYRLASLLLYQVQPLFQLFIEPNQRNKSQFAIHLFSGSTVLESIYLTNSDQKFEFENEINAYIVLQTRVAIMLAQFKGIQESDLDLQSLTDDITEMVRFEADLAKISKDLMSDSSANNNNNTTLNDIIEETMISTDETYIPNTNASNINNMFVTISMEQMEEIYKSIKWKKLFEFVFKASNAETNEILISSKEYLSQLMKLITSYSPKTIDNYLCWTFIARYLPYLGPQFRRIFSEFRTKVPDMSVEAGDPNGSSRIFLSRWKECVHVVSEGLDVPAIALYLQHKQQTLDSMTDRIDSLINQIKVAFNQIIDSQEWLDSNQLRDSLKSRINSIESKIGVPNFLTNQTQVDTLYHQLNIDSNDVLIRNIFKMAKHQVILEFQKLIRSVDPEEEWAIQPLIANAYYDQINNNIIMPPGILRYPLISLERPEYLDYSTLGIVIGHEIAHSMGSESRRLMFTNGSVWWTSEVNNAYKEKAKCFAKQYSEYPIETTNEFLNGNHTLEENICDFAGLQQSFTAYKLRNSEKYIQLPGLTNYNSDQLFFIQYAQIWCEVVSDEGHRKSAHDDHSPGRYRANGVLVNSLQFSKTFNCPENSPMNPTDKCSLWNSNQV